LEVVKFTRVRTGAAVLEVGAGTGNFLSLFAGVAGLLIAVDLTAQMLEQAREHHPELRLLRAEGAALPLASCSVDLAASAQVLHHVPEPLPLLAEMRRVARDEGMVLIVDQVAPERYEEAVAMNELEMTRDPSHAASRPPSAFRTMLPAAGLDIVDERVVSVRQRFSEWMRAGEFPRERIDAVLDFIDRRGRETAMEFEREGGEYTFTRTRIMLLARRA
jgi:ubiquinone/menaquinone biosynthesis C-methylase UbiE